MHISATALARERVGSIHTWCLGVWAWAMVLGPGSQYEYLYQYQYQYKIPVPESF